MSGRPASIGGVQSREVRIAYACHRDLARRDGVAEKIASQVEHWEKHGHEVLLHCLSPRSAAAERDPALSGRAFLFAGPGERVVRTRELFAAVAGVAPDLVYLRYEVYAPPPLRLMRRVPTVVEVNSDDLAEFGSRGELLRTYNRLQRSPLLRRAAGGVFVTHELAAATSFRMLPGPRAVIANGVDEASAAVGPAPRNERPRLLFLGSPVPWQGVDKLLWLATALPEAEFDLVGVPPLADPPPNLRSHGYLPAEGYARLLAAADVGIGTLALHRKRMNEACALKVRTYLAHGVPVLLGHEDTDFLGEEPWYLLRLPNREDNVREGVDRIRAFVRNVAGRRVPADVVLPRIGAAAKEEARLRFFARVLDHGRRY